MINPYSKKTVVVTKTQKELSESGTSLHLDKSGRVQVGASAMEDAKGEINAYSKKELMQRIMAMSSAAGLGELGEQREFAQAKHELVEAAIADHTGETWKVVGEVIGDEILETLGRDGFTRKVLMKKDLKKGEIGRIKMRKKDVLAFVASGDSGTVTSYVNQMYLFPDEFYIKAHIMIEERELQQSPGDLLDDKYQDGLEQIMVKEDQVLKSLLDTAAPSYNPVLGYSTFTPAVFAQSRTNLLQYGNPCATGIMAIDVMNDIMADPEFSTYFDPVSKRELILSGHLGAFFGVNLITDGFRYDTLRVLNPGEVYFLSAPNVLGAQTVRQDLTVAPVNLFQIGRPERGWFMHKIEGQVVANGRAVSKCVRI